MSSTYFRPFYVRPWFPAKDFPTHEDDGTDIRYAVLMTDMDVNSLQIPVKPKEKPKIEPPNDPKLNKIVIDDLDDDDEEAIEDDEEDTTYEEVGEVVCWLFIANQKTGKLQWFNVEDLQFMGIC